MHNQTPLLKRSHCLCNKKAMFSFALWFRFLCTQLCSIVSEHLPVHKKQSDMDNWKCHCIKNPCTLSDWTHWKKSQDNKLCLALLLCRGDLQVRMKSVRAHRHCLPSERRMKSTTMGMASRRVTDHFIYLLKTTFPFCKNKQTSNNINLLRWSYSPPHILEYCS